MGPIEHKKIKKMSTNLLPGYEAIHAFLKETKIAEYSLSNKHPEEGQNDCAKFTVRHNEEMYFCFNTCETDLLSRCNFCNKRQFPFISFRKAYQFFCSGRAVR